MAPRTIPVLSLKGGTGKSTCTAQLGLALKGLGHRVGFLDLDIHGPNLALSLGLERAPSLSLDTSRQVVLPAEVDGYELVSMASHFGEGGRILWRGEEKLDLARQLVTGVVAWGDLDYLMVDTPPSQGEEILALFEHITDIHGVVIVTQPTDFARADTERVLDFLRDRAIPIIGIVANMDGCLCPKCGERFYPFLTRRANIEEFAEARRLPLLASVPQATSVLAVWPYFVEIARLVETREPGRLPRHEKRKQFKREALKALLPDE